MIVAYVHWILYIQIELNMNAELLALSPPLPFPDQYMYTQCCANRSCMNIGNPRHPETQITLAIHPVYVE